ncbi:hypothetical protein LTS08_006544 [Lithohypha guttulata]|uniref:ABM domain-containing protein n=2 Tax=Lithohypha guttulata TaxID=1690604 RepID=A0AAN7SZU8_9EURO|nr:hypothetical protein LTR05_005161 [Lithohypha guttulata]KAK5098411.1 hypothetical protein LTS08_006544 [Lithohypha guttulata]
MVYTLVCHLEAKDDDSIEKIKRKLIEAARVYRKDKETVDWFVMQDVNNPRKFSIVERFEHESSQKYHLENPYWKTFDPYVKP